MRRRSRILNPVVILIVIFIIILLAIAGTLLFLHFKKKNEKDPAGSPGYEPAAGMPENGEEHILGVQANLWSEFLKTSEDFEYQLLPRMSAASEIQWCAADNKDYDRFRKSLDHMVRIYDKLGFVYCKALWGKIGLPGHEIPARSQEELDTLDFNKVPFMEE